MGYTGNAAIGVSWQIFLVVMVFISSLFTGMGVLVARFAGAGELEKVDRAVYQAFLTSVTRCRSASWRRSGTCFSPSMLQLVNATPAVRAEALPYLRMMFVFSFGLMRFFMMSGALRSAGDAKTPLRLGVALTVLNMVFNVILIRGLGPIPAFGTAGAADGHGARGRDRPAIARRQAVRGRWVVAIPPAGSGGPTGASSASCSASACRRECRASR